MGAPPNPSARATEGTWPVSVVFLPRQSVFMMLREAASTSPAERTSATVRSLRIALSRQHRMQALRPLRRQRAHGPCPTRWYPWSPLGRQVGAAAMRMPDEY